MNRVGIVYATKTKHSKKIAEAIGRALHAKAQNVTDNSRVAEAELLFIVGGIYGGDSLAELLSFVQGLDPGKVKRVALITSCASGKQGQVKVREILEARGIDIMDEWICPGSFLFFRMGRPNRTDLQKAVAFALHLRERLGNG